MSRRPLAAFLLLVTLLVAACGDSSNQAPAEEPTAEPDTMTEMESDTLAAMTTQSPCFLQAVEAASTGTTALERGQLFLEANGQCDGVEQTDSGLQYEIVEQGDGVRPTAESVVEVHYEGTLIDGTVFDSSYRRGETIEFPLNRVIPGWTEGVALMPVGSTYRLFLPSNLAYGSRGAGGAIGPDETLIFKVELIGIAQ